MANLLRTGQTILILHYNAYLGIDLMIRIFSQKQYIELFIPSIIALLLMIFNLVFASAICFQLEKQTLKDLIELKVINKRTLSVIDKMYLLSANVLIATAMIIQFMVFIYSISINIVNS